MSTVIDRQEYTFQAEIKQVLHLLSHSLYQSREIALRELISNASDALDKMRYISLTDESQRDSGPLEVVLEGREGEQQLVIRDTGIGMTHDELVANLGTIAHSGSGDFLKALAAAKSEQEKSELSLIGQFGVGFYAAFMIADRVRVRTRGYAEASGWEWESEGTGTFTITPVDENLPRGTEGILHLKDDAKEFASPHRIKEIVKRYSSFVPHPIKLGPDGEVINDQKPIWVEPKSQVTEEQYTQFYQHLTHHPEEKPLWHLHMAADSPIQFRAIVYCPPTNLESLGFACLEHGLNLCASRVLVQSDCGELVPEYSPIPSRARRFRRLAAQRFSARETLQDNSVIRKIRTSLVKGVLDRLDHLARDDGDKFKAFYEQFGRTLKEGLVVDPANKERIAKLLRFSSSRSDDPTVRVSFDEYLARMPDGQNRIYYLGGNDLKSTAKSPNLETFRRKGLEVVFLDRIRSTNSPSTRYILTRGKTSPRSTRRTSDLPGNRDQRSNRTQGAGESSARRDGFQPRTRALSWTALGNRVSEVRESKRLTDSPCCLVNADGGAASQMQRILKMANKDFTEMSASSKSIRRAPGTPALPAKCQRATRWVAIRTCQACNFDQRRWSSTA